LKLEPYPILDFLLLTPILLLYSIYFLKFKNIKIDLIHAHGLNAGFIGVILKSIYQIPVVLSTHATYSLNNRFVISKIIRNILLGLDHIFTLSKISRDELISIGIPDNKITVYKYWVDQDRFKLRDKNSLRKTHNIEENNFVVLFAGRLIEKKGVIPLIIGFNQLNQENTKLIIAGTGPLEGYVKENSKKNKNIIYVGGLNPSVIKDYYSLSDTLIIPSTHDEGFGRVILEALSSGLPIIGSNRGGIPEAVNDEVSILVDITPENIKKSIDEMQKFIEFSGQQNIKKICREFAQKNYSRANIETFLKVYEKTIR
jgi:glycosyltransferase involved in cell wall biosynthesis